MRKEEQETEVVINGMRRQCRASRLDELIEELGLMPETVVAELNGNIVPRADFAGTYVQPGDCLELVRFVGGG